MINKIKLKLKYFLSSPYFWEIMVIFILSLTPLLWYKTPNSLAIGHDLFFPLDPYANLIDRIHLWSTRFPFGMNQTQDLIALPIHLLDAAVYSLGLGLQATQKIIFIFWFFMIGLSAYYLASAIGPKSSFFRIFVSVFYMFNHFLLQAWFIAERPKFSVVIAIPFLLAFIIQVIDKKMKITLALALSGLTLLFFNGGSPPFYGGFGLVVISALLYFGILNGALHSFLKFRKILVLSFGIIAVFLMSNFYWIYPLLIYTKKDYSASLTNVGGLSGIGEWIQAISENTSIFNLLRLQGFPDWYGPTHPYGSLFLSSKLLLLGSILLLFLAYLPLFLEKRKEPRKYILYFAILSVISLPFIAGSHPPFGGFFNFLVMNMPGFAIFRTPFYKFAAPLWLSFAFLTGFGLYYIVERFSSKFLALKYILWVVITVGVLAYNFPFFTGIFFVWKKPYSSMVNVPNYIYEFRDWVNSQEEMNGKILFLPPLNKNWKNDIYKWNYWSFSSLPSLFINKDIIINDRTIMGDAEALIELYYKLLQENDPKWKTFNRYFGIRYVVVRNDFVTNSKDYPTASVKSFEQALNDNFVRIEKFGEWEIYELRNQNFQPFYITKDAIKVYDYQNQNLHPEQKLAPQEILSWQAISSHDLVLFDENNAYTRSLPSVIYKQCEVCIDRSFYLSLPKVNILHDSLFYFLVKIKENKLLNKFSSNKMQLIDFKLGLSIKRIAEIKTMYDFKIKPATIQKVLVEYRGLIKDVNKSIASLPQSIEKDRITARAIAIFEEQNKILLRFNLDGDYNKNEFVNEMHETTGVLSNFYIGNIKNIYLPQMLSERLYPISLEKGGQYRIYIQNILTSENDSVTFYIDGKQYDTKIHKVDNYSSLGSYFLSRGQHTLKIIVPQIKNIAPFQQINLTLKKGDYTCKNFPVKDFLPGQKYKFSFLHKLNDLDVSTVTLKIYQYKGSKPLKIDEMQFVSHNTLGSYSTIIDIDKSIEEMVLTFCSPAFVYYSDASIDYTNVQLLQISTPSIVLALDSKIDNMAEETTPVIESKKIDQTAYKVDIKGAKSPYFLVFPERFDSRWILYDEKGKEINTHSQANIFTNAWYIDKKGDYKLTLKFDGQEKQYYYYAVSIIFGILFVINILYNLVHKRFL